mmetsp:Transcript_15058/g.32472  ORF Transcript_15058/g.32472 Transcript_15058/m.32472 type:complete len:259 (+) Transcript_15058:1268-2044(+)
MARLLMPVLICRSRSASRGGITASTLFGTVLGGGAAGGTIPTTTSSSSLSTSITISSSSSRTTSSSRLCSSCGGPVPALAFLSSTSSGTRTTTTGTTSRRGPLPGSSKLGAVVPHGLLPILGRWYGLPQSSRTADGRGRQAQGWHGHGKVMASGCTAACASTRSCHRGRRCGDSNDTTSTTPSSTSSTAISIRTYQHCRSLRGGNLVPRRPCRRRIDIGSSCSCGPAAAGTAGDAGYDSAGGPNGYRGGGGRSGCCGC